MRISTNTIFESGVARINDMQSQLMKTQQQMSTGKRILTPADDPVAAARVLDLSQGQAINSQLTTNRSAAKESLSLQESVLQSVTSLMQDAKTLTVNAGNGTLDDNQRQYIASTLSVRFDELMGLANSRDGTGNYIFAGYKVSTQPFAPAVGGASYVGDQGQRLVQVSPSQQMSIGDAGDSVFQGIRSGNGSFVTAAASTTALGVITPTNVGSGIISPGSVTDASALTGHQYNIVFSVTGGTTTYDVVDATTSTTLSTANAYVSGQAIAFDGMQFNIAGSPGDTDQFTVQPSTNQSVFTTLSNLINALKAPSTGATAQANLTNNLNTANMGIDSALDNVLSVRASVGSRLQELDALDSLGESRDTQYQQSISGLQDLDYAKAISSLNAQQMILQAAQKSFVQTSNLSLFDLL